MLDQHRDTMTGAAKRGRVGSKESVLERSVAVF